MEDYKKKYEEALERAKVVNPGTTDYNIVTEIFPELKESEDKQHRKWILEYLYDGLRRSDEQFKGQFKCAIAWLEKQGEQKSADKIEPKFHEGDNLVSIKNPRLTYEVLEVGHINELGNPEYKVEIFTDGKAENPRNIHYMECYKVDEWAKLIEQNPAWSEEDEKMWITISDLLWEGFKLSDGKVSWDKIRCWLLPKIKSIKERVQIQPKQEWSEEDENMLNSTISTIKLHLNDVGSDKKEISLVKEEIDWLKSLKERMNLV